MYSITLRDTFPLRGNDTPHRVFQEVRELTVGATLESPILDANGMVYDFFDFKQRVRSLVSDFGRRRGGDEEIEDFLHFFHTELQQSLPSPIRVTAVNLFLPGGGEIRFEPDGDTA